MGELLPLIKYKWGEWWKLWKNNWQDCFKDGKYMVTWLTLSSNYSIVVPFVYCCCYCYCLPHLVLYCNSMICCSWWVCGVVGSQFRVKPNFSWKEVEFGLWQLYRYNICFGFPYYWSNLISLSVVYMYQVYCDSIIGKWFNNMDGKRRKQT